MDLGKLLIDLIGRAVCGRAMPSLDGVPSEEELLLLYHYTKAQDLAHLLLAPMGELGLLPAGGELRAKFEKQRYTAIYRSERMSYELTALSRVLEEEKIAHIPLKGAVIRELYPEVWMRTSTDIDVLVRPEDAERAADALTSALGYQNGGLAEHDIQLISQSGLPIELHFETIEEHCLAAAHRVLSRIWEHAAPAGGCTYRCELDGAMLYFYHIAHAAKHLRRAGSGIRTFLDLWLMRRSLAIDGESCAALLAEGGLTVFADAAERLAEAWFSGAELSEVTERLARYVLNGGIYGSRHNSIAMNNARHGKIGSAMRLIFLPYSKMRLKYPSLERHKLALPFCHLHRWCALIRRGRVRSSIKILRDNARIGTEMGGGAKLLLQDLRLDE